MSELVTGCDPVPAFDARSVWPDLPPGVPPLSTFYLYLSAGCNLFCKHCWITPDFVQGEPTPGACIDVGALAAAVVEVKPWGLSSAKLTGGEPLLHPEFVRLVDMLSEQEIKLSMETNGTLIEADLAIHLRRNTTMDHIAVSLDSPDAEQHDQFRGRRGAHAAAVRGIERLVVAGFRPQVIMSVYRGNLEKVDGLVALARHLGAGSVKFNPVTRSGRGLDLHERGEALSDDEVLDLGHLIRGPLHDRHEITLTIMLPPALTTVREILQGESHCGACNVRHILGILGSGEMALCGIGRNVPELCFGVLGRDSVREVWANHPVLVQLRRDLDGPYPGICGDCIHAARCQTACVATNYEANGALVSPPSMCAEADRRGSFPATRRVSLGRRPRA